jgi:small conductance mechanosensitive channel
LSAIRAVVAGNSRVLAEPAPLVQISLLADSAVQIAIKPWVAVTDYPIVRGELNLAVVQDLRQRGIAIPYPQREVRLFPQAVVMPAN